MTAFAPSSTALRDRHRHAAVLERPGRVGALDLEVDLAAGRARTAAAPAPAACRPRSSVTTGVASVTGSRSRYASIRPRHGGRARDRVDPCIGSIALLRPASRWPPPRTMSRPRSSSTVARQRRVGRGVRDDAPACASSPRPSWRTVCDDTSCSANAPRDRGEHAGLVGDVEADVVAGDDLAHRPDRQVGVRRLARRRGRRRSGCGRPRRGRRAPRSRSARRRRRGRRTSAEPAASASTKTALNASPTPASGWRARDHRRVHPHADDRAVASGALADASSLIVQPIALRAGHVGGGDRR